MTVRLMTTAIIKSPGMREQFREIRLLVSLTFPFDPVPASRPRVTKRGITYYAKSYKAWKRLAEHWMVRGTLNLDAATPLWVETEAIVRKPETSRLDYPRGDVDNYAKGPLDAITNIGGYWKDDRQILCLVSSKRFAHRAEQPRTEVHIYACV